MPSSSPNAAAHSATHHSTEEAGQRLKRAREKLNLRYRDVEEQSQRIAEKRKSDEFAIALSRLADIENRGTVPSIYRLYSLCAIYRLDPAEVLSWYGVHLSEIASDALAGEVSSTHALGFQNVHYGEIAIPVAVDPVVDVKKTSYLSRLIQRWGKLPMLLLDQMDTKAHRYGLIGEDDYSMSPILPPGSLVMIDESKRRIAPGPWRTEQERPIYFLENREGWLCGWCTQSAAGISVQFHPASGQAPQWFTSGQISVLGQVTGVAMHLDRARLRS